MEIIPPKDGSSKLKYLLYLLIIALIAVYTAISCTSLRYGSKVCDKDGNCSVEWYDSTVVSKPSSY